MHTVYGEKVQDFSVGNPVQKLDSNVLQANRFGSVSDLLSNNGNLFVKSYGIGSIANSSARGGSAYHTAILWNGFNIQNPMLGLNDFSLIPVNMTDNAYVVMGNQTGIWGSGAVGAGIHLFNTPAYGTGLSLSAGSMYGSFGNYSATINAGYGTANSSHELRGFYKQAINDFRYFNTDKGVSLKQTDAALNQYQVMYNSGLKLSEKSTFTAAVWKGHSFREIPPTIYQPKGNSALQDDFLRATAGWEYKANRLRVSGKAALFDEKIVFYLNDKPDSSRARTYSGAAEAEYRLAPRSVVLATLNSQYMLGQTASYIAAKPMQFRNSVTAVYKQYWGDNKWETQLGIRQEIINNQAIPVVPTLGIQGKLYKEIVQLGITAGRTYRVPTLNDMYWTPGGNPDLLPESGWNEDISLHLKRTYKKWTAGISTTVFNRNIDNWIMWQPSNGGIWSPQNLLKVWSRGVETRSYVVYKTDKIQYRIDAGTNYILSENRKAKYVGDESVGKQLIYSPMYLYNAKFEVQYKNWCMQLIHQYTGYVYTTFDHSGYTLPYHYGQLILMKRIYMKRQVLAIQGQVNNLYNSKYEVIKANPMPGINYTVGITWKLN